MTASVRESTAAPAARVDGPSPVHSDEGEDGLDQTAPQGPRSSAEALAPNEVSTVHPAVSVLPAYLGSAAIFVDAGWLLAAAALDVLGTPRRDELACNHQQLVRALSDFVAQHSRAMPQLRTYWYDGAPGGVAKWDHNRIAGLPYVTVRLGLLSAGRAQKGVDILLYRDLMTLARRRAIGRAYLLAGDEDLREAVVEAKDRGVQIVLVGMPITEGHNQSAALVRASDEYVLFPREAWEPHFSRRSPDDDSPTAEVAEARRIAKEFALRWAAGVSPEQLQEVIDAFPTLPRSLDIELVVKGEEEFGSLRGKDDLKQEMRGIFFFTLQDLGRSKGGSTGRRR